MRRTPARGSHLRCCSLTKPLQHVVRWRKQKIWCGAISYQIKATCVSVYSCLFLFFFFYFFYFFFFFLFFSFERSHTHYFTCYVCGCSVFVHLSTARLRLGGEECVAQSTREHRWRRHGDRVGGNGRRDGRISA